MHRIWIFDKAIIERDQSEIIEDYQIGETKTIAVKTK